MKLFYYYLVVTLCICFSSCLQKQADSNINQIDSMQEVLHKADDEVNTLISSTSVEEFHEGLRKIYVNGKYGFEDSLGNIVIEPKYDSVGCFNEGAVYVCIDGKYGYIDKTGKIIVEPKYEFTLYFNQGLAWVVLNDKYGCIDKKGNIIIDFLYDRAEDFWEPNGLAAVEKGGKAGLIDRNGKIVMPIVYESAFSSRDGCASIIDNHKEYKVYNDGTYTVSSF